MCRIDDSERSTVSNTANIKARKQHICCECDRAIRAGERYDRCKILYEGEWSTFNTCSHCAVAQIWLSKNCGGWVFEQVAEEIAEHAEEYPDLAGGLTPVSDGMRCRWMDGLMPVPQMPAGIASVVQQ